MIAILISVRWYLIVETNTTLYINCIPIKTNLKNQILWRKKKSLQSISFRISLNRASSIVAKVAFTIGTQRYSLFEKPKLKIIWTYIFQFHIKDSMTCMQVKKKQLEPDMEQWTGSKLGKEYVMAVYWQPANLSYIQSTSCKILGWTIHKLNSKVSGRNINNLRYAEDTTLMAEREEELKNILMKVKKESWKSWLKT